MIVRFWISFLIVLFARNANLQQEICPSMCKCRDIRNKDLTNPDAQPGKKVTCSGRPAKLETLDPINSATLPPRTVQLILRNNALTEIQTDAFAGLEHLKKLDLSRNRIKLVHDGAFRGLSALERLDLTNNEIASVNASTFTGLVNLERLSMNKNKLKTVVDGTFAGLTKLKRVEFSSPRLWCDCELLWIIKWMKNTQVRIPTSTQCAGPDAMTRTPIRDLKRKKLHCNWPVKLKVFNVSPEKSQIVFQGDHIPIECEASVEDESTTISWYRSGQPVKSNETAGVSVTVGHSSVATQNPLIYSNLTLRNVDTNSSGIWSCVAQTSRGQVSKTVTIVVISDEMTRCQPVTINTNKGLFHWPKSVSGTRMEHVCTTGPGYGYQGAVPPRAFYTCGENGVWKDLDTSQCQFSTDLTRVLQQFAQSSVNSSTALNVAMRIRQIIMENYGSMTDRMDVIFLSRIVNRLAAFVHVDDELVKALLDISTLIMNLNEDILTEAQREDGACSKIVRVIERIPGKLLTRRNNLNFHSRGVAMQAYKLSPNNYHGIQCWLDEIELENNGSYFRCDALDENRLLPQAIASLSLPQNLLLDPKVRQSLLGPLFSIQFIVYKNARLFPIISSDTSPEYEHRLTVDTPVISAEILDANIANLTEPVRVRLQIASPSVTFWPAYWDFSANQGHGAWKSDGCRLESVKNNKSTLYCSQLSHYAVMQIRGPVPLELFLMEPVVYAGSLVLLLSLLAVIITYITCHRYIRIPTKVKHSLVNTCIGMILLVILFTMASLRTDDTFPCQIIGMVTHYLTVSTLLWITITSSNLYKKYHKAQKPPPPPDEIVEPVPPKPILRFYFVGWGIGLIVCGITAAVDMNKYSTRDYCFLTWETCIGALLGPVGMLLIVNMLLFMCTSCILRPITPRPSRTEIEMDCPNSRDDFESATTSSVFDLEHKGHSQLRAIAVILFLYLFVWACAALIIAKPLRFLPYVDMIVSYAYGVSAAFLGLFILIYYCLSRSDARMCWYRFICCKKQVLYEIPACNASSSQATPSMTRAEVHQTIAVPNPNIRNGLKVPQPPHSGAERSSIESGTLTNRSGRSGRSGHSQPTSAAMSAPAMGASGGGYRAPSSASHPQPIGQSPGYLTESSLNSSMFGENQDVTYFYNAKQNTAAKRFWEKKHRRDVRSGILRHKGMDGASSDVRSDHNRSSVERPMIEETVNEETSQSTPEQPSQTPSGHSGHSLPPMPRLDHDSSPGGSLVFPPPPPPIALVSPIEPIHSKAKQMCTKHGQELQSCEKCAQRKSRSERGDQSRYYSLDRGGGSPAVRHNRSARDHPTDSDSQVPRKKENRRSKTQWEDAFKGKPKKMHAFSRRPDSRPYDSDYSQSSAPSMFRSVSAYEHLAAYSTMDDASSSTSSSDSEESYRLRKHRERHRDGHRHGHGHRHGSGSRHRHHRHSGHSSGRRHGSKSPHHGSAHGTHERKPLQQQQLSENDEKKHETCV